MVGEGKHTERWEKIIHTPNIACVCMCVSVCCVCTCMCEYVLPNGGQETI